MHCGASSCMPNHGNALSARVHLSLKTLTSRASVEGQSTDMISTSVFASRQLLRAVTIDAIQLFM